VTGDVENKAQRHVTEMPSPPIRGTYVSIDATKAQSNKEAAMTFLTKFDRWDPFEEMSALRGRMDRLWARVNEDVPQLANWSPTSDIVETKNEIVVKTELPGLDAKQVDVEVENGVLMIKGERKADQEYDEKGFHRVERSYGTFLRTFPLPPSVEAEKIDANFTNGLLEVHLPKREGAKPRSIKVDVKKQIAPTV
jgi:HSP20 family protein